MASLDEILTEYKQTFGGGLCPFDDAFFEAQRKNPEGPPVNWSTAGCYQLLEAFVSYAKARQKDQKPATIWMNPGGVAYVIPDE